MTKHVKFGIYVPNYGPVLGNAVHLANLTKLAEDSGWDGFFIWDHILVKRTNGPDICNPWVALGLMGYKTEKITLGTTITPLPRRKPWELAREVITVDQISNGRLILGVGLGEPPEVEYGSFGEETAVKTRREKLDESLEILQGLWTGEPFSFKGKHFNLEEVTFVPKPIKAKIPIWVAGEYPHIGPIKRAAKYDGMIPLPEKFKGEDVTLEDYQEIYNKIVSLRGNSNFDFVIITTVPPEKNDSNTELISFIESGIESGFTWFINYISPNTKLQKIEKRIKQGPLEL